MKTAIITGANAGIGFATAKYLASQPDWHVVLACRNLEKTDAAVREIRRTHPGCSIDGVPLDLFALSSVRRFAERMAKSGHPPLHALVLNAGGVNLKAKYLEFTVDGFERTFQLNFLGHFLLANLLVEHIHTPGRIIFVSSDLHDPMATKMGKIAPPRYGLVEDLAYGKGTAAKLKPMARYGTAKLYAMMTAYELDRRLCGESRNGDLITINSWSPGVVPTTQAARNMPRLLKKILMNPWFVKFMGSHLSTEEEAATALGGLAINPKFASISGKYFDGFSEILSSRESRDERKAKSVWKQTAAILASSVPDKSTRQAQMRIFGNGTNTTEIHQ